LFLPQLEADVVGSGGGGNIAQGHCDEDLGFWAVILCSEEDGAFGVFKGHIAQ